MLLHDFFVDIWTAKMNPTEKKSSTERSVGGPKLERDFSGFVGSCTNTASRLFPAWVTRWVSAWVSAKSENSTVRPSVINTDPEKSVIAVQDAYMTQTPRFRRDLESRFPEIYGLGVQS